MSACQTDCVVVAFDAWNVVASVRSLSTLTDGFRVPDSYAAGCAEQVFMSAHSSLDEFPAQLHERVHGS